MNAFAKIDRKAFLRYAAQHHGRRLELDKGRIVQHMTGGTARHGVIALMIAQQLLAQLDRSKWRVSLDRGVGIATSSRYPDVVVEPADEPLDSLETERPAIIVEVLSPSTTATDLNTKPGEYLAIPTLDAYIVASQDEAACLVWTRDITGKFSEPGLEVAGAEQSIIIKGRDLAVKLDLADVYQGIT